MQSCLSIMLESLKDATDKSKAFGGLLTDLLKAFACPCHDLLIAKLHAYGIDMSFLNLLQDYWWNCKQRTEVDSFFSCREDILSGVLQDSIVGSLLFNIFMCHIFLILKTIYFTGYADDNTPFAVADDIEDVIRSLKEVLENLITWFFNNQLKLNPDKCHLLLKTKEQTTLKIKNGNLLLQIPVWKINIYKFRLQDKLHKAYWTHLQKSIRKVKCNRKIGTIYDIIKKRILMNAFLKLQFNYCPLIWMCCNRSLNNKINRLH